MATVELLTITILSVVLSGISPFLAQGILRDRYREKNRWEKCGLESLASDPTVPESVHFLEYIRWAIPLRAVSRELIDSIDSHICSLEGEDAVASESTQIAMAALPPASDIKRRYELNEAFSLSMSALAGICAGYGLAVALMAASLGIDVGTAVVLAIIAAACVVMVMTDLAARLIPNCITLVLIAGGLTLQLVNGTSLFNIVLSMVCGSVFWAVCLTLNRFMRAAAIGGGDSKALFSLPLVTGIAGLLPALLVMLASLTATLILGIVRRGRKAFGKRIPLAPYIAIAAITGAVWQVV